MEKDVDKVIETLNPDERSILSYLENKTLDKISEKSGLDKTKVLRALQFLSNKSIVEIKTQEKKIVDLGDNGVGYLRGGLPERRLLNLLSEKKTLSPEEARKLGKLSENEVKAAIGALKKKAMIELKKGKIVSAVNFGGVAKKSLEEQLIDSLPVELGKLTSEQKLAFENLKTRKKIIEVREEKEVNIKITEFGKQIIKQDLSKYKDLIEELTPELLRTEAWKGKKFRRYDIISMVPEISGGKRHFVSQAINYARETWLELGFKEMTGTLCQTGFWNFDALFTPQDHPVREIQDTFYISGIKGKLPDKSLVNSVKQSHEKGVDKSKGWQYSWKEEEAKKVILRTHTTCLSSKTLHQLSKLKDKRGKFFAIGKCFRNDTLDWKHGFEFNQTEGIVVDENANFRHLLGYLKEFAKKMGYEKVRFRPHYFPYTEPSLEGDVWNQDKKEWVEVFAAGIFRPEVTQPLLGKAIPVLAWGPGFDRMLMAIYNIQDFRDFYKNNLNQLRKIKFLKL